MRDIEFVEPMINLRRDNRRSEKERGERKTKRVDDYPAMIGFVDLILSIAHDAQHTCNDSQWKSCFKPSQSHLQTLTPFSLSLSLSVHDLLTVV